MYCIHGSNKSVRYVSRTHLTHLWTGGDIIDVLSLFGIVNLILKKAQQERDFLCLLIQLRRRTAQRLQFLVRSLYLPPLASKNKRNLDASPQPRLVGESGLSKFSILTFSLQKY